MSFARSLFYQFNGDQWYFWMHALTRSIYANRITSMRIARSMNIRFSPRYVVFRSIYSFDFDCCAFFVSYWNAIKLFKGNLSANLLLRYVTFLRVFLAFFYSLLFYFVFKWKCYVAWCKCIWLLLFEFRQVTSSREKLANQWASIIVFSIEFLESANLRFILVQLRNPVFQFL